MERWEHLTVRIDWHNDSQKWLTHGVIPREGSISEILNHFGSQGWELIALSSERQDYATSVEPRFSGQYLTVTAWRTTEYRAAFKRRMQG